MIDLLFVKEYIHRPRTTGAILPSSERLACKMTEGIDFDKAGCIVEYGPGTGVFTDRLVKGRAKDTSLLLIEYNEDFCSLLREKYRGLKNLYIVNDSAEYIDYHLKRHGFSSADYIISGLPFASLPKETSKKILENTKKVLNRDGKFITFQYTLLKKNFIGGYFGSTDVKRVLLNIPPAYVFTCSP